MREAISGHSELFSKRETIYMLLDKQKVANSIKFVRLKGKKQLKRRSKDLTLLNMCTVATRHHMITESPLNIDFAPFEDFEPPCSENRSGELLAGGLELSF